MMIMRRSLLRVMEGREVNHHGNEGYNNMVKVMMILTGNNNVLPIDQYSKIHTITQLSKINNNITTLLHNNYSITKHINNETITNNSNNNNTPIEEKHTNINNITSKNEQTETKSISSNDNVKLSIGNNDFVSMYKKNKRKLLDGEMFCEEEVRKLLEMKYFYSDVVNVAHIVADKFFYQPESLYQQYEELSTVKEEQLEPLTITHLHFLLFVYHLYPRESKSLNDKIFTLINQFIDANHLEKICLPENMEFFFYLRKFIENEDYHKVNKNINKLNIKYTMKLKLSYIQNQSINNSQEHINEQLELLHNYLLVFPNLWNFPNTASKKYQHSNNQEKNYKTFSKSSQYLPSQEILKVFAYFVGEFEKYMKFCVESWMANFKESEPNKLKEIKASFMKLRMLIHRLYVIFDLSRVFSELDLSPEQLKPTKSSEKFNNPTSEEQKEEQSSPTEEVLETLTIKYFNQENGKLCVLTYLPQHKMKSEEEFLTLLKLVKQMVSYHIIRDIDNQSVTHYLHKLFENNLQFIQTKNPENRRKIIEALNNLISKLASCSWVDKEDELGKFFSPEIAEKQKENVTPKKSKKDSWYEVKTE